MTIRHHISENLLLAHACGQLPEAFDLVVATHLSLCDECRARSGAFDALGGAVVAGTDGAAMAPDALEVALARIGGLDLQREVPRPRGGLPMPLADYVGGDLQAVRWRPVGMGVRQAILDTGKGATARLLHIPAGAAMPDHGHGGLELTLVLQGSFSDASGTFATGDVEVASEDVQHVPIAGEGLPCICLAASDAPLRFRGWLPRLLQPVFRI